MRDAPDISVCVPVYKAHDTPNVATLAKSMSAALGPFAGELVIALNGVEAGVVGGAAGAITVDLGVNRGVAPGWNAAAGVARGRVLVFANDDVVLGEGSLAQLARTLLDRPQAGVVGPLGSNWDLAKPAHRSWVDPDGMSAGEVLQCDVVSGFLLATRREVYERAGGFDEYYAPCTCEELDLCMTVRRRLGLECLAVAGVAYRHQFHISSAKPWRRVRHAGGNEMLWRIHRRNVRHFKSKWAGVT